MKSFVLMAVASAASIACSAQAAEISKHTISLQADVKPFCTAGEISTTGDFLSGANSSTSTFDVKTDQANAKNNLGSIAFGNITCNTNLQVTISGSGVLRRDGGDLGELLSEIPYSAKFNGGAGPINIVLDEAPHAAGSFESGMGIGFSIDVSVVGSTDVLASGIYSSKIEICLSAI